MMVLFKGQGNDLVIRKGRVLTAVVRPGMPPFMGPGMPPMPPGRAGNDDKSRIFCEGGSIYKIETSWSRILKSIVYSR